MPLKGAIIYIPFVQSVIDEHRATLDPTEPRDLIDCFLNEQKRLIEESNGDAGVFGGKL
jgi:hypothetical protein